MHWYHLIPHTLQEGSILLALYSGLCALGLGRIKDDTHRWYALLFVPLLLASYPYWLPILLDGWDAAGELTPWQLIFIVPWFVSGACSSLVVGWIVARVQRNKRGGAPKRNRRRPTAPPINEI